MIMSIVVTEYTATKKTEWDAFVRQSNNGTLFHLQDFLAYHPEDRFMFHHLMFYRDNKLLCVLPGGKKGRSFISPTGASYGGFVTRPFTNYTTMESIVQSFISHCKDMEIENIHITPPMQIYNSIFDEVVEYALLYNKFTCSNSLYSSIIDLSRIRSRADLAKTPRYCVNKAERAGVQIMESDNYSQAYDMLVENKKKFQTTPTHSLEELIYLHNHFPQSIKLFLACHERKPIAGQWIFLTNSNCALIFYSMHLYEYRNLYSLNLLLEHVIKWVGEKGFRYLDYGVSADTFHSDPMEPSRSLVRFKESVGCTGCLRKTYTLTL